ncbi:MAG: YDG domain-containing protein [Agriterribacter sp.]
MKSDLHLSSPHRKFFHETLSTRCLFKKNGIAQKINFPVRIFFTVLAIFFLNNVTIAQTTYDFSTSATLSYGTGGFGVWYTQADITIGGVAYKLTCGGNGSFANAASGGVSNSKCLTKDGSGGDMFTIERTDGQPFQFYGIWVKHQSMNSYSEFYSLPPFYTITYNKYGGGTDTDNDNTAMQGGTYTTSAVTFTKNVAVTSVSINFKAITNFWIDNIIVGPVSLPAPVISTNPSNKSICSGANTTFTAAASNSPTYQWQVDAGAGFNNISNGAPYSGATSATLTITGATAGLNGYQYRCVATNASGSATTTAATLTVNAGVTATTSQTNVACNGGSNGSATVVASGGTNNFSYSWSPSGGTAATASGLSAGAYVVTITDVNTCSTTKNITITQPSALIASTSQVNIACNGGSNGSATVSASGGTPSYTYSWAPSGGTAATATGLAAGVYTCTITDANNCQITKTITLTQPSALTATTSQNNVSCNGGSNGTATVSASGGTPSYTYSWAPSGGTNSTASGLAVGVYTCTITDANACQITKTVTITQPTALSATTAKTDVSCNAGSNGTASVSATGGTPSYTYSWAPSGGTAATATGLAAGVYTCTITDANACQITKSITVTQPTAISTTGSKVNVSCNGGSNGSATVSVTGGTGAYTYSWSPSGGTSASATGLAVGVYTVTVTDANACTATRSFTITQPTALTATTSQTNISCNGGSNGTATVSATGGTPSYTYSWAPSGGTSATATGLAAGVYTCTITDANSCQITKTITLTQPTALTATTSKTNVSCNGGSNGTASVSASGGTPSYTYSWSPSGGTAATATGLAVGVYNCTITDANNCQIIKSITITQPTALSATTSKTDVSCNGGSNGTATVNATGGTPSYTYSWAPSGGTAATATGLAAGTYTCTITDANSCTTTKSFTITQPVLLTATATPSSATICSGGTTDIALNSVPSGASFTWTVSTVSGNVSGASSGNGSTIEQTLSGNGVINYTVSYTNGTCSGSPITVPVTVNALTAITDQPVNTGTIDEHESATFSAKADYASTYQWQVNEGEGFVNINNNETYSGVQTEEMTVLSAEESMNGYLFRCIVSGNCSPVTSSEALLTVKVRTAQHLSFAESNQVTYGDDDYAPAGVSDAGLEITYTSSNTAIAEIINGKIHIKQAGTVTITASQAGDSEYKPATSVSQELTIGKKNITVTLNAAPAITKVYDGNTGATLVAQNYTLNGVVGSDDVSVTGTAQYAEAKAGDSKQITANNFVLHGEQKDNYNLTTVSADVTGAVSKKEITVAINSSPSISKTYNGNKNVILASGNYEIDGVIGEDEVSVSGTASFEDKNVGEDKLITVNGFVLEGSDADNYTLVTESATSAGSISPKAITVTIATEPAISKTYDGSLDAQLSKDNYVLHDVVEGDDLSVSGTATYDNRHAGDDKVITIDGFILSGEDKNNYVLETSSVTSSGSIAKKSLTVTINGNTAITKEYDGTTTASVVADNYSVEGIIGEDLVVLNNPTTAEYDTKHGGNNKKVTVTGLVISGEDAGDYALESTIATGEVGTITKKAIAVSAEAQTKVYGVADPVLSYTTEGKLEGDELPGTLGRAEGKHVGEYEINIGTLSGGDDYEIEDFNSATLVITPAPLTIKADSKTKKQGAANPEFTFTYDGLAEGDVAANLDTLPVATSNATTGSPIGVYDIKANGAASHDYTISYENGSLTVTPAGGEEYSLKVWSSSPDAIQIRIYSAVPQKASIILYTEVGQKVIIQQKQLSAGINSYTLNVSNIASSTYVLGVAAEKFKDAQKVKVK